MLKIEGQPFAVETSAASTLGVAHNSSCAAELQARTLLLHHKLRNMLTLPLLVSDLLLEHPDPKIAEAGEIIASAITRAVEQLK